MKISIITPSYNQANYLEQTILSVLNQDYDNIEYIIIDGGSTDGSVDIIKKYEDKLAYWISEKDKGQSHAINKGLEYVTGDVMNWLNSDDWLEAGAVSKIMKYFQKNPEIDVVFGNCNIIYPQIETKIYKAVPFDPIDFASRISVHQPSTFWRACLMQNIGRLDESLNYCMDYDLWAKMLFTHKSGLLNETLANFRRYPESKSSNFEDQSKVFYDYRKVISRIIFSLDKNLYYQLEQLGLDFNKEGIDYNFPKHVIDSLPIQDMYFRYILTCAEQEYILKNKKNANKYFKVCFNSKFKTLAFREYIKNNLGFRDIFHPYRKN